jgi:6,7-dimethyl-8-ribityllumazine synthase
MPDLSDLIAKKIPDAADMCFGIVVAEKNPDITGALLKGAVDTLQANGAISENIHVKAVPSVTDLVYGAHQMSLRGYYDAVLVLGCIIRGETAYFDCVCQGLTYGISKLNTTSEVPIIYGVLSTDTKEQAYQRSENAENNKGNECAIDAIKMAKF